MMHPCIYTCFSALKIRQEYSTLHAYIFIPAALICRLLYDAPLYTCFSALKLLQEHSTLNAYTFIPAIFTGFSIILPYVSVLFL